MGRKMVQLYISKGKKRIDTHYKHIIIHLSRWGCQIWSTMKCIKNWVNASKIVYASFLLDEGVKYDQTCLYQQCSINKGYKQCHPGFHTYLIHICHHFWYQTYGGFRKRVGTPYQSSMICRSFQYKPSSLLGTPPRFPPFFGPISPRTRTKTHGGHLGDPWHRQRLFALIERFLGPRLGIHQGPCGFHEILAASLTTYWSITCFPIKMGGYVEVYRIPHFQTDCRDTYCTY